MSYQSTKIIELGSCAFRQWRATHSHCKYVHGYQLKAKLWFGASTLDDKNWCVDFGGLKELKAKLQFIFDHTTTVAADDPELETFKELDKKGIIQLRVLKNGVGVERVAETVYVVAQEHINSLTNGRCWVEAVEVFEHEENSAIYKKPKDIAQSVSSMFSHNPFTQSDTTSTTTSTTTPTEQPEQPEPNRGASVGNKVTQGMGNPFAGTSWG